MPIIFLWARGFSEIHSWHILLSKNTTTIMPPISSDLLGVFRRDCTHSGFCFFLCKKYKSNYKAIPREEFICNSFGVDGTLGQQLSQESFPEKQF